MPQYDPTPDMIRERCLEVQSTWDADTFESRKSFLPKKDRPHNWMPPCISTSEFEEAIKEFLTGNGNSCNTRRY